MFFHDQVDARRFYDRWGPTVLRYCQLYLGDLEQAESATREAFVGFFKGTPDLKDGLPIRLMQLAVTASRNRCLTPGECSGAEGLEAFVRLLPYQQRSVFLMRGTFNLAASEIAEITDRTVNEVNKLWLEALLSLRRLWLKKVLARRSMTRRLMVLALALAVLLPHVVFGQNQALTLDQALERARRRAPLILAAQDRIEEARGRLLGARVLLRDNPVLELSGGPRYRSGSDLMDAEVGLSQSFELGGRRRSRIAAAQADVERETAASQNVVRELLRDVATAFWQAVAAAQRVQSAQKADGVAGELRESMQRRYQAGDVPVLDVNVARNAAARTRAEVRAAEAEQTRALGDLRIFLGMRSDELLSVDGLLATPDQYDLDHLTAEALKRPDLEAIAAELRQAEAEVQLGGGFVWPDLGLAFRYGKDEGTKIAKGGLTLSLPVFSRGQELRATGGARATRLRRELEANRLAIANEVRTAFEVHRSKLEAAEELRQNAVQALDENETLARRSFEEGEINLLDLLLIRRDAFETRLIYLNQLLESKLSAVDLEARAGVLK